MENTLKTVDDAELMELLKKALEGGAALALTPNVRVDIVAVAKQFIYEFGASAFLQSIEAAGLAADAATWSYEDWFFLLKLMRGKVGQ